MDFLEQYNKIIEMKDYELFKFFSSCSIDEKENLLVNPYVVDFSPKIFRMMFVNLSEDYLIRMLNNEKIYKKLMTLPREKNEKNVLNNVKLSVFKKLVESEYAKNYSIEIKDFLSSLRVVDFNKYLTYDIDYSNIFSIEDKSFVANKFNISLENDILKLFFNKLNLKQLNPIALFKINNYEEFVIFTKFGLIVNSSLENNNISLKNGFLFDIKKIELLSEGKVNKIIKLLESKYGKADQELTLEIALKLYYAFGYDNAKKIIEDKFTNLTDSAVYRINEFSFKKERQEYRISHPNEFYQHVMIEKILKGDRQVYNALCKDMSSEEIENLIYRITEIIKQRDNVEEKVRNEIKSIIDQREQELKEIHFNNLKNRLINKETIDTLDKRCLYNLLLDIDLNNVAEYTEETLEILNKVLFGNGKKDNDCLFRLLVLKEANGITLSEVINNIDVINAISINEKFSLENILEISNILKMKRFGVKPNEIDVNLDTLTKIVNSKHYCDIHEQELIPLIFELHTERKEKVYSTIPTVSGSFNNIEYEVAPFDADYLLAAGIDGESCFKIGGPGEEFFKYCLLDKNAVIIYLTDETGKKYVCPTIRSGNGIHCNGIDPECDEYKRTELVKALEKCFKEIIKKSNLNDKHEYNIEVATLTNLNMKGMKPKENIFEYDLRRYLPIGSNCYNDYNKKDITNYILAASRTYNGNYYYDSNDRFYQKRAPIFEYTKEDDFDQNIINIVNSIAYTMIDYKNINERDKYSLQRNFKEYKFEDFEYIVGNKDWFIAVDHNFNIIANLLPYDERAKEEYFDCYKKLVNNMSKGENNGKSRKNI